MSKFRLKLSQVHNDSLIFLYKKLYSHREHEQKENFCSIQDFNQTIESAYSFTFDKFQDLIKHQFLQNQYVQLFYKEQNLKKGTKRVIRRMSKFHSNLKTGYELKEN